MTHGLVGVLDPKSLDAAHMYTKVIERDRDVYKVHMFERYVLSYPEYYSISRSHMHTHVM